MWTLEKAFSRYGAPAREMNETLRFYHERADTIDSIKRIKENERRAVEEIEGLRQFADMLESTAARSASARRRFIPPAILCGSLSPAALIYGAAKNITMCNC